MIQFIIDKFEYFIALGVFAYGVMNDSIFFVCVAIMMWIVENSINDWKSKK